MDDDTATPHAAARELLARTMDYPCDSLRAKALDLRVALAAAVAREGVARNLLLAAREELADLGGSLPHVTELV